MPDELVIDCNVVPGKQNHLIVNYNLSSTDKMYKEAFDVAPSLAQQLNPHGPDGRVRSIEVRETMAFTGAIAELIVLNYLNECFSTFSSNGDVVASTVPGVQRTRNTFNQIDIRVEKLSSGKSATVEVRSSNIFKQNTYEVYNVDQSLVGWYATTNKSREIKKDFYIMLYFRHSATDLQARMQNKQEINVQLAAGASKEFIQEIGIVDSLRQGGNARYNIIRPIVNAYPVRDVAKQIILSL